MLLMHKGSSRPKGKHRAPVEAAAAACDVRGDHIDSGGLVT